MENFPEQSWEWLAGLWQRKQQRASAPPDMPPGELTSMLREQFLARQAARRGARHVYDIERAWKRVAGRQARRATVRWTGVAAGAAAVLLAAFLLVPRAGEDRLPAIVPGTTKAELWLANGEVIPLERHGEDHRWKEKGIVLDNDTASGRLRYDATGSDAGGENRYHTLRVPRGGEYQLDLPDGTRVWINSRSSARFPERFGDSSRDIYLQGEAYFDVARDERVPFRVHTGDQVITVTGTRFNVSAYDDDGVWRATLVEGNIRVEENGNEVTLRPAEQYVLDREQGTRRVERVDAALYTSWVDGRFYFKAFAFEELARKLERWYDFRMIYTDESVKGRRFTGLVNKHEPIEHALSLLEMTTDIQFQVVDKTITVKRAK
ncbi:MAG: FecR domain-containing protein [Odoribacteraceae bacterium]|jgi:ferric-dicitrate binding protein FerR (iron transport regulator)|nr:FecR domain-containing protein [Odoribacteraceae bacterium]